jgi:hypothetical protein
VAWYLDFRSCSIANDLSEGLSFRFARALASFSPVLGNVEEVFSEVQHGVDVDS